MKMFLLLVLSVTALFVWQRQGKDGAPSPPPPTVEARPAAASSPRAVSEHNWAKHSLDRTHKVMDQVQLSRGQNDLR